MSVVAVCCGIAFEDIEIYFDHVKFSHRKKRASEEAR